ncbi:MAG: type I-B CRISPR-associated protein Cas7/Cst2/DevR [Chlorobi bacterium]|nr:type I-B CRISPR-associated protein Cas7/Cst2/DevR [Chlorobiota bacterium]
MSKNIIGFILIDAPYSALNNAGSDAGERTENTISVKSIRKGKDIYPYISAQALRYWWRETLEKKCSWEMSPIERETKIAFTQANPFKYPDDDVFGYMRAQGKSDGGTVTRLSPLKNSPLISIVPNQMTSDFGVMSRQKEGDPVPHEHQFYSTVMHGIFSLDLESVGIFLENYKTGQRHLNDKLVQKHRDSIEKSGAVKTENDYRLPKDERTKRVTEAISVLPFISGGAKSALHLTDVTPKLLVMTIFNSGNHIFMNLAKNDNGQPKVNICALEQVLTDYADYLATDVYIARRVGFMDELEEELVSLNEKAFGTKKVIYNMDGSFNKTVETFTQEIATSIPE